MFYMFQATTMPPAPHEGNEKRVTTLWVVLEAKVVTRTCHDCSWLYRMWPGLNQLRVLIRLSASKAAGCRKSEILSQPIVQATNLLNVDKTSSWNRKHQVECG
jgi:hypothetical protein